MVKLKLPKDTKEAIQIQLELAKKLILKDQIKKINKVAGVDIHYKDNKVILGYVKVNYSQGDIIEKLVVSFKPQNIWSYIPEFLCFSEGIYIVKFLDKLREKPDILILDGHGIAHPRKMGLASYVGVICDIATVGCAKNILYGSYDRKSLKLNRGSFVEIKNENFETIAVALRTKDNTKEVFVSAGHKISLNTAKEVVLKLSKYRIPEPLRLAHIVAKNF
ncbi:MAG: endonuclease V [Elusimicrobiota bacterium]|nr:endonuclease V [Endomicrobiia bacterium]MDW8166144.1 endonuclease V [Elusimicrobiota bacterium]